nr:hypothetical protein [Pseudopedobacter sp.]
MLILIKPLQKSGFIFLDVYVNNKSMKTFILIISLAFISIVAYAQDCVVLADNLKGTYEGGCKKGKADGIGALKGDNSYEGEFKNGYPQGIGKFTFSNGDIYNGAFKKGEMEGEGEYIFADKSKSIKKGFWKDNKYIGKYLKPYEIYTKTSHISRSEIKKILDNPENSVTITVESTTGGLPGNNSAPSKPVITDIIPSKGSFLNKSKLSSGAKSTFIKLTSVNYPFKAKVRIGNEEFEFELLEEGFYTINIFLNE